jgi:tRNA(Ile)-lysidine synthetase-like protein
VARADAAGFRLERRVAGFVERENVLRPAEHVLLMLSGGADSMALLALLPGVGARLGLQLRLSALHVDYGARGADSDRDREIVARGCAAAGVPLHVVRLGRRLSGAGFQARARALRYERAGELAAARGCDVVATAHNRDDQAETVLYRLTKYASPRGLAGMRPRERRLARPLLCLGAAEIREYCRTRGIEYGEDVTNARPVYARNALRLEVLPALARLNPRVAETLSDTAAMAAAEADVLAAATAAAAARAAPPLAPGDLAALDIAALSAEAPALRALVLHDAAREALGGEALVERRVVEALLALCARRDDTGRTSIGRGLEAVRSGGVLRLRRRAPAHVCEPASVDGAALAGGGGGGGGPPPPPRPLLPRPAVGRIGARARPGAGVRRPGRTAAPRDAASPATRRAFRAAGPRRRDDGGALSGRRPGAGPRAHPRARARRRRRRGVGGVHGYRRGAARQGCAGLSRA